MNNSSCTVCQLPMYDEAGRRPVRWHDGCETPLCTLCAYNTIGEYEYGEQVTCPHDGAPIADGVVLTLRGLEYDMCWTHGALLTWKCKRCKKAFCKECFPVINEQMIMRTDTKKCTAGTVFYLIKTSPN